MVNNIIRVIDDIHKAVLHQGKVKNDRCNK